MSAPSPDVVGPDLRTPRGEDRNPAVDRQSRAADLRDHAGKHHAGARHHDRQRGAPAYPRQPVGLAGPDLLGADLVHCRRGDHDAADRLARRPLRHQNRLCAVGRGFHPGLGAVRQRHQPDPTGDLSRAARHLRRRAGAAIPGGAAADQPGRAAWSGDGGVRHRHNIGADLRPGARRLADLRLQLALGFLYQPAGRDYRHARHADFRPRKPPWSPRAVRPARLCHPEPGDRRSADAARPRRVEGLVRLDRDLGRSRDLQPGVLPVHRAHRDGYRPIVCKSRPAEKPQFHGRYGADVHGRADHERHLGAVADDAAGSDELPGADHRAGDRAARRRLDDRDVRRRPRDRPGRQPADHPDRAAADRGFDVADDPVLAGDGDGADHRLGLAAGVWPRLHVCALEHDCAVQPAAAHPDPGHGATQPDAQSRRQHRHRRARSLADPEHPDRAFPPGRAAAAGQPAGARALSGRTLQPYHAPGDRRAQRRGYPAGGDGRLHQQFRADDDHRHRLSLSAAADSPEPIGSRPARSRLPEGCGRAERARPELWGAVPPERISGELLHMRTVQAAARFFAYHQPMADFRLPAAMPGNRKPR